MLDTGRRPPPGKDAGDHGLRFCFLRRESSHRLPSRAVSRGRNSGISTVLGIRLDGLDDEVEFVGTVDLPRHAVILARCGCVGFGEVMQPINATGRVVSHEQNGTGAVFHPREQEQVIGAEVEHRRGT